MVSWIDMQSGSVNTLQEHDTILRATWLEFWMEKREAKGDGKRSRKCVTEGEGARQRSAYTVRDDTAIQSISST